MRAKTSSTRPPDTYKYDNRRVNLALSQGGVSQEQAHQHGWVYNRTNIHTTVRIESKGWCSDVITGSLNDPVGQIMDMVASIRSSETVKG